MEQAGSIRRRLLRSRSNLPTHQTRTEWGKRSGGDDWSRKNVDVPSRRSRSAEGPASGPPRRFGAPSRRRGVLRRRPHLVGRGHLLRALARRPEGTGTEGHERRRRLGARHGWEVHPGAGIRRGPHYVRPRVRVTHGRRGGPPRCPRSRGCDQGTGLPELRPRSFRLAGQGHAGALLPHLQRAHRRSAGAIEQPDLRGRSHQLVGCRRGPTDAARAEGARTEDLPHAAVAGQGRRRQADRLR